MDYFPLRECLQHASELGSVVASVATGVMTQGGIDRCLQDAL